MDEETRGLVEKVIDDLLQDASILQSVEWIKGELPIQSLRDMMIGWWIGSAEALAHSACILTKRRYTEKQDKVDENEIRNILKRRLPEVIQLVTAELNR